MKSQGKFHAPEHDWHYEQMINDYDEREARQQASIPDSWITDSPEPEDNQPPDASHLSQSATDTADLKQIQNYWKSHEGRCLACKAEIAVEDQYCPSCESFLLETLPTIDPNLTA